MIAWTLRFARLDKGKINSLIRDGLWSAISGLFTCGWIAKKVKDCNGNYWMPRAGRCERGWWM